MLPAAVVVGLGLATTVAPLTAAALSTVPVGACRHRLRREQRRRRTAGLLAVAVLPALAGHLRRRLPHPRSVQQRLRSGSRHLRRNGRRCRGARRVDDPQSLASADPEHPPGSPAHRPSARRWTPRRCRTLTRRMSRPEVRCGVASDAVSQQNEQFVEPTRDEIPGISRGHVAAMEATDDDAAWVIAGMHHVVLRTIGRRSGNEHKVALPFWADRAGSAGRRRLLRRRAAAPVLVPEPVRPRRRTPRCWCVARATLYWSDAGDSRRRRVRPRSGPGSPPTGRTTTTTRSRTDRKLPLVPGVLGVRPLSRSSGVAA